jgi:hypothetical protein
MSLPPNEERMWALLGFRTCARHATRSACERERGGDCVWLEDRRARTAHRLSSRPYEDGRCVDDGSWRYFRDASSSPTSASPARRREDPPAAAAPQEPAPVDWQAKADAMQRRADMTVDAARRAWLEAAAKRLRHFAERQRTAVLAAPRAPS